MIALDVTKISELLSASPLVFPIEFDLFDTLDSSNAYLIRYAKSHPQAEGMRVCLSESQSAGRGRLGRVWQSPPEGNLYLSCLYRFNQAVAQLSGLSLVVGLSLCHALSQLPLSHQVSAQVKWPNDVMLHDKKLAGILLESLFVSDNSCDVVIGLGVNVGSVQLPVETAKPWTSLFLETREEIDRNLLCALFLSQLCEDIRCFISLGFSAFLPRFQAHDYLFKKQLLLENGAEQLSGQGLGVDLLGRLLLQCADTPAKKNPDQKDSSEQHIKPIVSGEASVLVMG